MRDVRTVRREVCANLSKKFDKAAFSYSTDDSKISRRFHSIIQIIGESYSREISRRQKNYDLISIVVLNLGKKTTSHKLLNFLYLIFIDLKLSAEKETILHDEYHIDITHDMKEELKKTSGLMEPAIEVATERATAETKKNTLLEYPLKDVG